MKSPYLQDDTPTSEIFVEDKKGNFVPIEELLKPYYYRVNVNGFGNWIDFERAKEDFGTSDPVVLLQLFLQVTSLRRGSVMLKPTDLEFIIAFIRTNRPQSSAQLVMLSHAALLHLEIMQSFQRMEKAYSEQEYEQTARTLTRLSKTFTQIVTTFEMLSARKLVLQAQLPDRPQPAVIEQSPAAAADADEKVASQDGEPQPLRVVK